MKTSETRLRAKIRELQKSLDLFDIILENVNYGVVVQNTRGKIVYENRHPEKISLDKKLVSLEIMDKDGNYLDLADLPYQQTINDFKTHTEIIKRRNKKAGEEKWTRITAVPVFDKKDQLVYIVSTMRDITGRIMEQKRRDHFIAIGSHELRTPLTGIKALNQVVHRYFLEKQYSKALPLINKIEDKTRVLAKIIQDFIDVEKIRGGKLEFAPESFEFGQFIKEIVEDQNTVYKNYKIKIKGTVKGSIIADKPKLEQVVNNLLSNARKYSPNHKAITVELKNDKNRYIVGITDRGIGLTKDDQKHIFEPFYRIRNTQTEKISGLGLGLYIAYKVVSLHGGRMWIKSQPGAGSTFYFSIPKVIRQAKISYDF